MGNRLFETYLLYRASRDGCDPIDFHSRCDGKGPTLSLIRTEEHNCIGGFTNAKWSSPNKTEFKKDESAFLFNLTN